MSNNIDIISLNIARLYLDSQRNILHFDILNNGYVEEDFLTLIEYLKNFWILALENKKRYHMLIDVRQIGFYPLNVFSTLLSTLKSLAHNFSICLHSSCLLFDNELAVNILKPILSAYKSVRPFTFVNNYEEAIVFFNKNKLESELNSNLDSDSALDSDSTLDSTTKSNLLV